jgi:uncharacterized protein (UPF0333 family)
METKTKMMIAGGVLALVVTIIVIVVVVNNNKEDEKHEPDAEPAAEASAAEKAAAEAAKEAAKADAEAAKEAEKADAEAAKKSLLNIYRYNGKDVLCPPKYNFAKQQRFNKQDRDLWTSKFHNCWMSTDTDDCFIDEDTGNKTCDPRKYYMNGFKWPVEELGDPRGKGIVSDTFKGLIRPSKPPNNTNSLFFISAIPYDDKYIER